MLIRFAKGPRMKPHVSKRKASATPLRRERRAVARLLGILLALALLSCMPAPGTTPSRAPDAPTVAPIAGRAEFGPAVAPRTVQATMSEVADGATVSLIDQETGRTIVTTVTDDSGRFQMTFRSFRPATSSYYLEAVKGLANNAPNHDAMRVRTLIQFVGGGWVSMTSAAPNLGLVVDVETTALSIISGLRGTDSIGATYVDGVHNEIGILDAGPTPDTFTPGTLNISQGEFAQVCNLVNQCFTKDRDPFFGIGYDTGSGQYALSGLAAGGFSITGMAPATGSQGDPFTLTGQGFNTTLASNSVTFAAAGSAAALTSASETSLTGTVPNGALSGQVRVQIGNLIALGPSFTVPPVVGGRSPASGYTGATVTVTGTGFDPASTTVTFPKAGGGTVASTPAALAYGSFTVQVPANATTGPITVTTPGGTATSAAFSVVPYLSSASPVAGGSGVPVTLTGTGFGATQGTSTVTFNGLAATVSSWSNTSIAATVPAGATSGNVVVTTPGGSSNGVGFVVNFVSHNIFDSAGNAYTCNPNGGNLYKISTGGAVSTFNTTIPNPATLAFDATGQLYVAATNQTVYKVSSAGVAAAWVTLPNGVAFSQSSCCGYGGMEMFNTMAFDPSGNLYICNNGYSGGSTAVAVYKISPTGNLTYAYGPGGSYTPAGCIADTPGNVYFTDPAGGRILKIPAGGGTPTVLASGLNCPGTLTIDKAEQYLYYGGVGVNGVYRVPMGGGGASQWSINSTVCLATDVNGTIWAGQGYNTGFGKYSAAGAFSSFASAYGGF